ARGGRWAAGVGPRASGGGRRAAGGLTREVPALLALMHSSGRGSEESVLMHVGGIERAPPA
ncbi:MAG TPA: hypothetical protein VFM38_00275, partial [Candidatus Limnocylindrales bacterium]|nr:hypothetical protein [Candidatus Limnocylindrales bacterium]